MSRPGGNGLTPERAAESVKVRAARPIERSKLDLDRADKVVEISRTRSSMPVRRFTNHRHNR